MKRTMMKMNNNEQFEEKSWVDEWYYGDDEIGESDLNMILL